MSSTHAPRARGVSPARRRVAPLGRGVRTQRATVLTDRMERRDQASADLWLAVTAANPGYLRTNSHPAVDAAVTTVGLAAAVWIAQHHQGLEHTIALVMATGCGLGYLAVLVKFARWCARVCAACRDFAALPDARRQAALGYYEDLRATSPNLFPRPAPGTTD